MSDAKKNALKIAKARAAYRSHLESLQLAELILRINDVNSLTAWELTSNAAFVGAFWPGDRLTRLVVTNDDGDQAALTPPKSRVAPIPPNIHADLGATIPTHQLSTIELEFSSDSKEAAQELTLVFRLDTDPAQNVEFKADCILPADQTSATLMSLAAQMVTGELVNHLKENALYYSQAIWMDVDPGTLTIQLSPYQFDGKRVIEYVDPTPLSTAGNYLVFRWKDEAASEWKAWKQDNVDQSKVEVDLVSLPTGGVFAEAVLGRFNSAEKLDITRFWNWQDSPIPIQAPEIAAIQAAQHQISEVPQTGSLEAPIINIQTPPSLPDPTGMSSIITALTAANMFRDMSGAAQTAALAQAALQSASQGANAAQTQAGANMATAGQFQVEMTKALLPVIGAALGIPVPASTGTSNISNAGAAINHGANMDAATAGQTGGQAANPLPFDPDTSGGGTLPGSGGPGAPGSRQIEAFQSALGIRTASNVVPIGNGLPVPDTGSATGISILGPADRVVDPNETVILTANVQPASTTVLWNGGGAPVSGTGGIFTTRFPAPGEYSVTASISTDTGAGATATVTVHVRELSGAAWVARFPQSTSTADLVEPFRGNVESFIAALTAAGAPPNINTTFRPRERAYLMHNAPRVAAGTVAPSAVPSEPGVDICWQHRQADGTPDIAASREAAQQMATGYDVAFPAAFPTHHSDRLAIDMTITWTGDITVNDASGNPVLINTEPRTGGSRAFPVGSLGRTGNTQLHAVGATYNVIKLVPDPPHWSDNGS